MKQITLAAAFVLGFAAIGAAQSHTETQGQGQIYGAACTYSVDWPGHSVHIDATVTFHGTSYVDTSHVDGWEHAYTEVNLTSHVDNSNLQSISCGGDDTGDGGGDFWDSGYYEPPAIPVYINHYHMTWAADGSHTQIPTYLCANTNSAWYNYPPDAQCNPTQGWPTLPHYGYPDNQALVTDITYPNLLGGYCAPVPTQPGFIYQSWYTWQILGASGSILDGTSFQSFDGGCSQ